MSNRIMHLRTLVTLASRTPGLKRASACLVLFLAASVWLSVQGQQFTLVSENTEGGASCQSGSFAPQVSDDGRYIVYNSRCANLVSNLTGNRTQVFRRDLQTGVTELVSANAAGTDGGNDDSGLMDVSADGRFVVFFSGAQNLTASSYDTSPYFVRDMLTHSTTRISVGVPFYCTNAVDNAPSISADGSVVLVLGSTDLVGCDYQQVFAWNRITGTVTQVSRGLRSGGRIRGRAYNPIVSATGRYVFFMSTVDRLVPGDNNGQPDIFMRDLETDTLQLVSVNYLGNASGNAGAYLSEHTGYLSNRHAVTPDGRYVAFVSGSQNLVSQPGPTDSHVFVRDMFAGTTSAVPLGRIPGTFGTNDLYPSISLDGRFVVFQSTQRLTPPRNEAPEVLLFDAQTGITRVVSHKPPVNWTNATRPPGYQPLGVSPDGRYVAYVTVYNSVYHYGAFLRDTSSGTLVQMFSDPNLSSTFRWATFGQDGTVAFSTYDALSPRDQNDNNDIYFYRPAAGFRASVCFYDRESAGSGGYR